MARAAAAPKTPENTPGSTEFKLERIGRNKATIRVVGTAPLIVNKFSSKAQAIMLAKQMGQTVAREHKNPEDLFQDALYRMPFDPAKDAEGELVTRYGFPSVAFKASIVDAARYFKGSKITMTGLKQMVLVMGEGTDLLVPITNEDGSELAVPQMRQDTVRNATGVADIRFRPEFWPWSATLDVVFISSQLDTNSIVALVDAAGNGGVGEWRPASKESKTGQYGTFMVPDQDVKVVKA